MSDRNEPAPGKMAYPAPGIETANLLAAGNELSRVVQEACEKGMVDADGVSWLTAPLWAWERAKGCAGEILAEGQPPVAAASQPPNGKLKAQVRPYGEAQTAFSVLRDHYGAASQPDPAVIVRPLEWVPGFCDDGPCFKASEYGEPGKTYVAFDEDGKAWHEAQRRTRILSQTRAAPLSESPGERMIRSAEEAVAIARGEAEPARLFPAAKTADLDPQGGENMTEAARDVLAERRRQVSAEGWTPEHDDRHEDGELAAAGGLYAFMAEASPSAVEPPPGWPWEKSWWKPKDPRADLVRAGALILAEIERMDRAAAAGKPA